MCCPYYLTLVIVTVEQHHIGADTDTYITYKTAHIQLYIGNIIAKEIAHITATYVYDL